MILFKIYGLKKRTLEVSEGYGQPALVLKQRVIWEQEAVRIQLLKIFGSMIL
jgi:hypothetical protein